MGFPFPGVGIVFEIDDLKKLDVGSYGYAAHGVFMQHVEPAKLSGCTILHGDTRLTLSRLAREFCIAVYGPVLDIAYLKDVFGGLEGQGLAPRPRRFIDKPQLDDEPLPEYGRFDRAGVLITPSWDIDDHEQCKKAGWQYAPKKITVDLSADLRRQLKAMRKPRSAGAGTEPSTPSRSKWWQFRK